MSRWTRTQNKCCKYCGTSKQLTKDHIMPTSRGGKQARWNYQVLCKFCNQHKSNLTEVELAVIFRDIKKRGVWYDWEEKYSRWLEYLEIKREEYQLPPLNW